MAASHQDENPIPLELLRRVNAARVPCEQFKEGSCSRGNKCPRSHDREGSSAVNANLRYINRYKTADGRDAIILQPPLGPASRLYFYQLGIPCVLGKFRQWDSKSGERMITCSLQGMCARDVSVCEEAENSGYVWAGDHSGSGYIKRYASSATKPGFHNHSTNLTAALSILADGAIREGPGAAGIGVYSYACGDDQESTALDEAWSLGASRKANMGALFVFKAHGILISAKNTSAHVPPGATARTKVQYCSHPGVIEYLSFTTTLDGWITELSQQFDALWYTRALHEALMDVVTHMEAGTVSKRHDYLTDNVRRIEDKRKSLHDAWTDDDWKERKHWKSGEDAGVAKTESELEVEKYRAEKKFIQQYQAKMQYQAKKAPRPLESGTWASNEWGSAYTSHWQPHPWRSTSSAASSSRGHDRADVKHEPGDDE